MKPCTLDRCIWRDTILMPSVFLFSLQVNRPATRQRNEWLRHWTAGGGPTPAFLRVLASGNFYAPKKKILRYPKRYLITWDLIEENYQAEKILNMETIDECSTIRC